MMEVIMLKKMFFLLLLGTMLVLLASCRGSNLRGLSDAVELTASEQVHRMLFELTSYRAVATVEYRSNRGANTYETVQHARITGEYRIEVTGPPDVAGSVTVSDGRQIQQFNSRINGRVSIAVSETPERSEIFLTSFILNYKTCQEVSVSVADMDEGIRTVLEANIPGSHPYLATSRLWVDNETLIPVKLIIFDADGAERVVVTYHIFEYNVELEDELFTV